MDFSSTNVGSRKFSLQDLYPPAPARIVPCRKGRWGWVDTVRPSWISAQRMSAAENSRCRTYTPPRRHASFHAGKDDGGGLTRCRPHGFQLNECRQPKILAARPIPRTYTPSHAADLSSSAKFGS